MNFPNPLKKPLFVSLDIPTKNKTLDIVSQLANKDVGFKVGPSLIYKYGLEIVKNIKASGPVFLDTKIYDIPNTMETAVQAAFDIGASFVTIHGAAGSEAFKRLKDLEVQLNQQRYFKILVVTVLTSFDKSSQPKHWKDQQVIDSVKSMVTEAGSCGLTGFVCSGFEAQEIKQINPESFIVVPGVRLAEDASNDQKRIITPKDAYAAGASAVVVGRPIIKSADPLAALQNYLSL